MKQEEIIEKLRESYKVVTGNEIPDSSLDLDTDLRTDMGLSSIGMLYFVIIIESAFNIRFNGVGIEDFKTLGDVVRYIGEHAE